MLSIVTSDDAVPLDSAVLRALPQGQITLSNNGNTFEIVIQDQSVKVNGLKLVPFAVLTGLHSKFLAHILLDQEKLD